MERPGFGDRVQGINWVDAMLIKILHWQECFRVFSKDETGCITAEEMKWVTRVEIIVVWQTRDPVETLIGSYTTYFLFWKNCHKQSRDINNWWGFYVLKRVFLLTLLFYNIFKVPLYKKPMFNPGRNLQDNYSKVFFILDQSGLRHTDRRKVDFHVRPKIAIHSFQINILRKEEKSTEWN